MSNSFKATNKEIESIISYYKDIETPSNNNSLVFLGKANDFSVLVYKTNTVLFQGKNAANELNKWYVPEVLDNIDHIGSDEVGCGDYFGPIVVTSAYVKKEDYQYLIDLGVKDSKQINDETIKKIAPQIIKRIKTATFILSNKKYNEIHEGNYNLNKIKAYLHNFVLYKLASQNNFKGLIVVDQFCDEELYYSYLNDYKLKSIQKDIYFTPKAENKYIAVACASIVARYTFLNEIKKLEEKLGYKIILGASDKVDKLALKIVKEKGLDYLTPFVKIHYKNTEKIKESL